MKIKQLILKMVNKCDFVVTIITTLTLLAVLTQQLFLCNYGTFTFVLIILVLTVYSLILQIKERKHKRQIR